MNEAQKFFTSIDYAELRQQKAILVLIRDSYPAGTVIPENLSGIVHLLDALQDTADTIGLPAYEGAGHE